jgi:hypothetical protein
MAIGVQASQPSRLKELSATLTELMAEEGEPANFYRRWLGSIMEFVEAHGASLRLRHGDGEWKTPVEFRFPPLPIGTEHHAARHGELIFETFVTGRPKIIPPRAELGGDLEANPTDDLLVMTPLAVDGEVRGVVEILLPVDASAHRQSETLQAVQVAGESVGHFERVRKTQSLQARLGIVDELDLFTRSVYAKLSLRHVCYVVANDGKRLIGCDRITVLIRRGRRYDIAAVSGVDEVETRSESAKAIRRLAECVCETDEPLSYSGAVDDLSPQLREAIGDYVDETHVRTLDVLPLRSDNSEKLPAGEARSSPPLGALVIERLNDSRKTAGYQERIRFAAEHATAAIGNSLTYERIPLQPIWRLWNRIVDCFAPVRRFRSLVVLGCLGFVVASLIFIPADFTVHAEGVLKPSRCRYAFAPLDGTVETIYVKHGDRVSAGRPLLLLRNVDLEVALVDLGGQRTAALEQLSAVERSLYEDSTRLVLAERHRLSGQRSELKNRITTLDDQLVLLRRKKELLVILSPAEGEVVTWNLERLLHNRPIKQGQVLLEVAETGGGWELELKLPEDDVGHVTRAQRLRGDDLRVDYCLASDPERNRTATVREMHLAAEVHGEEGSTVLVRATLDDQDAAARRFGAEAVAKIECGRRSIGYVWLHDAVDYVRTEILFRIP